MVTPDIKTDAISTSKIMVANILERSDRFLNKYLEFDAKDSDYDFEKSFKKQIPITKKGGLVKYL